MRVQIRSSKGVATVIFYFCRRSRWGFQEPVNIKLDGYSCINGLPTFKVVLDKSHSVVHILRAHMVDAGAKTCNRKNNDVANFLVFRNPKKVGIGDIAVSGTEVEKYRIVEVGEDCVCPQGWTSEFNDALRQFAHLQEVISLHLQCILGDCSYNVTKYWMPRLSLNSPLAELYSPRKP
jgi:hypothetical protein